jgi:hypothetical protein
MITLGFDFRASADNQETLKTVTAKPVQLVFETVAVRGQATVGKVIDGFAFDRKAVLKTKN